MRNGMQTKQKPAPMAGTIVFSSCQGACDTDDQVEASVANSFRASLDMPTDDLPGARPPSCRAAPYSGPRFLFGKNRTAKWAPEKIAWKGGLLLASPGSAAHKDPLTSWCSAYNALRICNICRLAGIHKRYY